MRILETNNIWGIPTVLPSAKSSVGLSRTQNIVPIKRQLHTFLTRQIDKWEPDLIIVIERKGTAILRALKDWNEDPLNWPWDRVISSSVVDQMPDDYFCGKKILIFDEMMRTGIHLSEVLKDLCNRGVWNPSDNNLHLAVFAVHEEGLTRLPIKDNYLPYDWFYRDLTTAAYQRIRTQIVRMLQQAGSLMLDTEHIEVRIGLNCNFNQFIKALRRKSKALAFRSSDQRTNITVFYEDDEAHWLPTERFPKDIGCKNIVRKCRIIQRESNEFSIIPICYPSILKSSEEWPKDKEVSDLLGDSVITNETSRFYGVALLAALKALGWVLKDLAVMGTDNYSISLPKSPSDVNSTGGYCLDHLLVMYPTIDIEKLTQWISEIEKQARSEGTRLKGRKFEPYESALISDKELRQNAISLLQVIRYILDQRIEEYREYRQKALHHPFGLRAREIFNLGRRLGWEDIMISALFDILIDEANLVTHVQNVEDENGEQRLARTFEPDGEIVSELIRRYTNQWGLPHGF